MVYLICFIAPAITIDISSNIRGNISFIGETILLNCTVSGAGNLDGTVKIQWNTPNRVLPQSLLSKTIELTDAGQYICCATISASPYLNDNITKNMTKTLHVSSKYAWQNNFSSCKYNSRMSQL